MTSEFLIRAVAILWPVIWLLIIILWKGRRRSP